MYGLMRELLTKAQHDMQFVHEGLLEALLRALSGDTTVDRSDLHKAVMQAEELKRSLSLLSGSD